jgi:PIN domain nuclease of toxin-antitoxin system
LRILIDTCLFLWVVEDSPRIPTGVRADVRNPDNELYLSVVSAWEIGLKNQLGKLPLSRPAQEFVTHFRLAHGIESLPLVEEDVLPLPRLPMNHYDPFDRMLVCQAISQGLTIFTPDPAIRQYPVRSFWA